MVAQKSMYEPLNSCVRYWQKINFLSEKKVLFLHIVELGNENGNVI